MKLWNKFWKMGNLKYIVQITNMWKYENQSSGQLQSQVLHFFVHKMECNCHEPRQKSLNCSRCLTTWSEPYSELDCYRECKIHRSLLNAVCTGGIKAPPLLCQQCDNSGWYYSRRPDQTFELQQTPDDLEVGPNNPIFFHQPNPGFHPPQNPQGARFYPVG